MDIKTLYDNEYFKCNENKTYLFIYDNLNIDLLSQLFNREKESIIYQNGILTDFVRIFCKNKNNQIIASIHKYHRKHEKPLVNGIIVKITNNELEILKSYYQNYTLYTCLMTCTSSKICYDKIINNTGEISYSAKKHKSHIPYIFIYDDYFNDEQETPSINYVSEIRKMLNDRANLDNHQLSWYNHVYCKNNNTQMIENNNIVLNNVKIKPRLIRFRCITHKDIERKYRDDDDEYWFSYYEELNKEDAFREQYLKAKYKSVVIGYENNDLIKNFN